MWDMLRKFATPVREKELFLFRKLKRRKMEGWIKVYRKILDNPIATKPLWAWLWVYLLLKANHQPKRFIWNGREMIIERGQLLTGLKSLSKESHLTIQTIRSALDYLKSTSQVTIKITNKYRIITIRNYESYQEVTSKVTNKQQSSNNLATTNKNDKNEKNINNTASELKKTITEIESEEHIRHDYQVLGLELYDQLRFPLKKKAEVIRVVRDYPRLIVNQAYSFARDYPVVDLRWKMFFKKLSVLMKNEKPNQEAIVPNK